MTNYKSMYKYELANAAGVSMKTFRKWMANDTKELMKFGYKRTDGMLCPGAVKYLCEKYVITID